MSSVRVYEQGPLTWALSPPFNGPFFPTLDLIIDGLGGTPIVRFDGRKELLAAYTYLDADLGRERLAAQAAARAKVLY